MAGKAPAVRWQALVVDAIFVLTFFFCGRLGFHVTAVGTQDGAGRVVAPVAARECALDMVVPVIAEKGIGIVLLAGNTVCARRQRKTRQTSGKHQGCNAQQGVLIRHRLEHGSHGNGLLESSRHLQERSRARTTFTSAGTFGQTPADCSGICYLAEVSTRLAQPDHWTQ